MGREGLTEGIRWRKRPGVGDARGVEKRNLIGGAQEKKEEEAGAQMPISRRMELYIPGKD